MSSIEESAQQAVDRMLGQKGITGAALVGRDGLPVVHRFEAPCNPEALCAMAAAMLGAADAAMLDLAGKDALRFQAETDGLRLAGAGLDDEMLILLVAEGTVDAQAADALLDEAAAALKGILQA